MLGVGANLIKSAYSRGLAYVRDGLKLYMPYRGANHDEVKFVGTGSTAFDGVNNYIDIGSDINLGTSSTISLWVGGLSSTSDTRYFFGSETLDHFQVKQQGDTKTIAVWMGSTSDVDTYTYTFDNSDWVHLAFVRTSTTVLKVYLNGALIDTLTHANWGNDDTKIRYIGRNSAGYYIEGNIKNVAFWERALTTTEVQNVMYKTYDEVGGRLANGLVSWWALDARSLGSDLSDDNCAVSDGLTEANATTGWDGYDGSALTSVSTNPYSGSYHFHCVGNGSRVGASSTVSGLGTGKRYQVVAYVKSSDITDVSFRMDGGSFSETTSLVADTWTRISTIWDADDGNVLVVITSVSNEDALKSIDIDNVSIKEISTEDLKGSNDGEIFGAVIDEDLYGGDTPIKPRAIDNAPTVQADGIGAGSALFVDGNEDYIKFGGASSLGVGTDDFSILVWIKNNRTTVKQVLWSYGGSSTVPSEPYYYLRIIESDDGSNPNKLNFNAFEIGADAGSAHSITKYSTGTITDSNWHHIALTFDRDNATGLKMYIDGVLDSSQDGTTINLTLTHASYGFMIGARDYNVPVQFLDGNMCQAGLWTKALSQAQVQSVMEKTYDELNTDDKTSLVSYWPLDVDGTDSHGSNDGTLS